MSAKGPNIRSFSKGLLPYLVIAGVFIFLIVRQSLSGIASMIGLLVFSMLLVGGVSRLQLLSVLLGAGIPFIFWFISASYRLARFWVSINPWYEYKYRCFGCISFSLIFRQAGFFGVGLGNGKNNLAYLPRPHTDNVISAVAQELGFLGVSAIILMFSALIMQGLRVALHAQDLYVRCLALSMTCLIGFQVVVNMGRIIALLGLLPSKGVTFPLIAYGGCSMFFTLLSIGILLNIASRT
jgi:cell division protein FtsW